MPQTSRTTPAELIAEYLVNQDVKRVYGLCGGHIQPMWDAAAQAGIEIVDTRHEGGAVHMAHAESMVTGNVAVAMVTAGPGLTNAVTAIANASISGASVLVISGRVPRPQAGMRAMQDLPQADIVAPLCVRTEKVSERHHVLPRLDAAVCAALGFDGAAGPAYIDFAVDLLDEVVLEPEVQPRYLSPRIRPVSVPDPVEIQAASALIRRSRRPLVIGGAAVRHCRDGLVSFLDRTGAVYLDTGDSRGVVPPNHPAHIPAMRSRAMKDADLVITLGKRLDFQLGYGSTAVFPSAAFLRIGRSLVEVAENRRAEAEIRADSGAALFALEATAAVPTDPDVPWLEEMKSENRQRSSKLAEQMSSRPQTEDGRMHPYSLIAAVNEYLNDDGFVVADGGDILSFARVGLRAVRYLDCGALGCLGVGVPFAIAAALNTTGRTIALIGDGSFGFSAIEVDTAVRRGAKVLFVVANNEAWNIERMDQLDRFDGNLVGVELPGCRYDVVAQGLGAYSERVDHAEDLPGALERGLANAPALLDVMVTRDAVSPDYANGLATVPSRHVLKAWHDAEMERYH